MAAEQQIFNDPVHGSTQLDPLLVKIIDTPQFQRLRDIKQLGVCYWVYPGASHNRFEHCIGTSYLCGQMIATLRELHRDDTEPKGDLITPHESVCIKIAGLCRDLGYGPFSHVFHEVLIPKLMSQRTGQGTSALAEEKYQGANWVRDASCKMFDFMLDEHQELREGFDQSKVLKPGYREFIKDLIRGEEPKDSSKTPVCSFKGCPNMKKSFLYEIVSNNRNHIDCNKFDYIARDCHNVGIKSNFDWKRYLQNIRIIPFDGKLQICVRDKETLNLYQLFHTRWSLYHQVYRHKTKVCIEDILVEALLKAEAKLKISELIKQDSLLDEGKMSHYTKLTDSIFFHILGLPDQTESSRELKEAQELLLKIQRRKLYKFCGHAELDDPNHKYPCPEDKKNEQGHKCPNEKDIACQIASKSNGKVLAERVHVSIVYFDYGMEDKNPVDHVVFYDKSHGKRVEHNTERVSYILPKRFHERYIRVYAKSRDDSKRITDCFMEWCHDHKIKRLFVNDSQSGGTQETQR